MIKSLLVKNALNTIYNNKQLYLEPTLDKAKYYFQETGLYCSIQNYIHMLYFKYAF